MNTAVTRFKPHNRLSLVESINTVCAEGQWMSTLRFEPTPAWRHALQATACPHHQLLVAEDAGRIVGWCRLFPLAGCSEENGKIDVGIGLLPQYRGLGLGKRLLHQGLDWAIDAGLGQAILTTKADNVRAIHLFRQCGFQETGHEAGGWLEMICQLPLRGG